MTYLLTAEELILSLIIAGDENTALAIKNEVYNDISPEELEHRLDCGTNGLLSKGLINVIDEEEKLESTFYQFLTSLSKVKRVVRCQHLLDQELVTSSVYFGENKISQRSLYNNRVFHMEKIENDIILPSFLNLVEKTVFEESFTLKESELEVVLDELLEKGEIINANTTNFPPLFLEALIVNQGKLNTLYDYKIIEDNVEVNPFLYLTHNNISWLIQEEEKAVKVKTVSFNDIIDSSLVSI